MVTSVRRQSIAFCEQEDPTSATDKTFNVVDPSVNVKFCGCKPSLRLAIVKVTRCVRSRVLPYTESRQAKRGGSNLASRIAVPS